MHSKTVEAIIDEAQRQLDYFTVSGLDIKRPERWVAWEQKMRDASVFYGGAEFVMPQHPSVTLQVMKAALRREKLTYEAIDEIAYRMKEFGKKTGQPKGTGDAIATDIKTDEVTAQQADALLETGHVSTDHGSISLNGDTDATAEELRIELKYP